MGLATDDPRITSVNNQILMLEEIFENRRNMKIKRPMIKNHVMSKLRNGLATPAFLNWLGKEKRDIDKYILKNGYKPDEKKAESLSPTKSRLSPPKF